MMIRKIVSGGILAIATAVFVAAPVIATGANVCSQYSDQLTFYESAPNNPSGVKCKNVKIGDNTII